MKKARRTVTFSALFIGLLVGSCKHHGSCNAYSDNQEINTLKKAHQVLDQLNTQLTIDEAA